jgi:hypothetical protein
MAWPNGKYGVAFLPGASHDLDFDVEITGFSLAEIDLVLDEARESSPDLEHHGGDGVPPLIDPAMATTRPGDLWHPPSSLAGENV